MFPSFQLVKLQSKRINGIMSTMNSMTKITGFAVDLCSLNIHQWIPRCCISNFQLLIVIEYSKVNIDVY